MNYNYRSFHQDFYRLSRESKSKVACINAKDGRKWNYAELYDLCRRCSNFLSQKDIQADTVFASILPNSLEQLVLFLSALLHGSSFVPISPSSTSAEAIRIMKLAKVRHLFVPKDIDHKICFEYESLGISIHPISVNGKLDWVSEDVNFNSRADFNVNSIGRLYVGTSGTTGEPKLIIIDGNRLWSSAFEFIKHYSFLDSDTRFYNILPMSYMGGLFNLGIIPLVLGASVVIDDVFSTKSFLNFWTEVKKWKVNVLWSNPMMVRGLLLIQSRSSSQSFPIGEQLKLRPSFVGMAPIELDAKRQFEKIFGTPLLDSYGISETTFISSEIVQENGSSRSENSVGRILSYAKIRFNSASEIEVLSPFLCLGYIEQDGFKKLPLTEDGYFQTGDSGYFSKNGDLVISGRIKDIIKKGGNLIVPREIENCAIQNPSVLEAAAVGVPHALYGEDIVLFVRLNHESDSGFQQSVISCLQNSIRSALSAFKQPSKILVLKEFPRTQSGKVLKRLLIEEYLKNYSPQKENTQLPSIAA